jgi:Lar family restriction alleviation protein
MSDLKPCPFCSNKYINLEFIRTEDRTGIEGAFIECPVCQIETRIFDDPDEAVEFWNRRSDAED